MYLYQLYFTKFMVVRRPVKAHLQLYYQQHNVVAPIPLQLPKVHFFFDISLFPFIPLNKKTIAALLMRAYCNRWMYLLALQTWSAFFWPFCNIEILCKSP